MTRVRWFTFGYATGVAVMVAALLGAYGYFVEGSPKRNVKPASSSRRATPVGPLMQFTADQVRLTRDRPSGGEG